MVSYTSFTYCSSYRKVVKCMSCCPYHCEVLHHPHAGCFTLALLLAGDDSLVSLNLEADTAAVMLDDCNKNAQQGTMSELEARRQLRRNADQYSCRVETADKA